LPQGHFHHPLHFPVGDGAGSARSRSILLQSRNSAFKEAVPATRRFLRRDADSAGDLLVFQARGGL
jgi:hypothetical protein